jgi:argininosuccinate synthase
MATFDAEVVAMTLDLGQGGDLEAVRHAAMTAGACRAHVLDVREEFARECIVGSLTSDGDYGYPRGEALARPLVARKLIEIAKIEGAIAVAHGGDAVDHLAIERTARTVDPAIRIIAAAAVPPATPYTVHTTLWGRSIEHASPHGGTDLPEEVYSLTAGSARVADVPANLEISFKGGLPVAINGVPMTLTELVESVTTIAGNHGVGRVRDEAAGIACEAPAAVVFHAARTALGHAAASLAAATVCVELFRGRHRVVSAQHS